MQGTGEGGGGRGWKDVSRKQGGTAQSGKHLLFIFSAMNRTVSVWQSPLNECFT